MPTIDVTCQTCGLKVVYMGPLKKLKATIDAADIARLCVHADHENLANTRCPDLAASLTAEVNRLYPQP